MTTAVDVASAVDTGPRTGSIRVRLRTPARRRNIELVLLLFALAVGGAATALVELGALGRLGTTVLVLEAGLAVLLLGFHVALRVVAPDADPFVLPIATLLNGLGIAEITRLDIAEGLNGWDAAGIRQIVWTAIAIALSIGVVVGIRNHRVLQRFRYIAMFTAFVLLVRPVIPGLRSPRFGAYIWIPIGPLSFQPGELAKLALAVFFA
ncbi:MAG: FtsW/RodA/SpoVE family cell cycle protein, partial [Pseudolysinimonas sp.]